MPSTSDTVAAILAKACAIRRDTIEPAGHPVGDLGPDSLEIADAVFSHDRAFGVVPPIERCGQSAGARRALRG